LDLFLLISLLLFLTSQQTSNDLNCPVAPVTRFIPRRFCCYDRGMQIVIAVAAGCILLQASQSVGPRSSNLAVQLDPSKVTVQQLTYAQLDGTRNAGTLVTPTAAPDAPRPAILFLHWYGPPDPSSNRTQYLPEAVELAQSGVVSLLVDTPWSREAWFGKRDGAKDYELTVQVTKDVRRALDVLLAQPLIDTTRVALVGHDFGAMWGALAAADDLRVTHVVYAAGTRSFSDWFLYTPKREGADRDAFVAKLAPLDPIAHLPRIAPRPVLLQFGTRDEHVKNEAAAAQAEAAREPKSVKIYQNAGHELTYQARVDRLAWLKQQFKLER
jgi:fermentation-respiration switch protein FrsA (DUF1100 family)